MFDDLNAVTVQVPMNEEGYNLYPVGDLHFGSAQFDEKAWQDYKKRILNDERGYVVLVGDLLENATRYSVGSGVYEQRIRPRAQID